MNIETQLSFLRAARAWLGEDQSVAAKAAGIGLRTLVEAEKGDRCSDKTWNAMLRYYESRGIILRDGSPVLIQIDQK